MAKQAQKSETSNRGFAAMDENRQREIASMGGVAAHRKPLRPAFVNAAQQSG